MITMLFYQVFVDTIHGQIWSYKNNKFRISAPKWNEKYQLHDRWYSISDIQIYSEYILKRNAEKAINLSIKIYVNE